MSGKATPIPKLPPRNPDAHKGDFGRVLVVGGSLGMAGAPCLAALAAYRSGAGLVRLAIPEPIQTAVSILVPGATNTALPATPAGTFADTPAAREKLLELAAANDVLVIGPGMGRDPATDRLIVELARACDKPMVIDADGLRAIKPLLVGSQPGAAVLHPSNADRRLPTADCRTANWILTPHPGEFAHLTDSTSDRVQADRAVAAEAFVNKFAGVLVLKGNRTLVYGPGRRHVNTTGNPGMATGGSGDVLAGVIAALAGQGLGPMDAAVMGTYIHGLAGDLAAAELGQVSLIATDLIERLPAALLAAR